MVEVKKLAEFPSLETIGIATEYFPGYVKDRMPLHGVDVVLLSLVISGRGVHYLNRERVEETGRSLTVTHYGEKHAIISQTGMNILNVYLNLRKLALPSLGDGLDYYLEMFLPQQRRAGGEGRIYRIELAEEPDAEALAFAIHRELEERKTGFHGAVLAYFRLFLLRCCRRIEAAGLREIRPDEAAVRMWEVRHYLEDHYASAITLAELAERSRYQKNYLCRLFKRVHQESIFDFLLKVRLRNAAYMLLHGDRKVLAVALDCGFSDLSYFVRMFKRQYGSTPLQYRNHSVR